MRSLFLLAYLLTTVYVWGQPNKNILKKYPKEIQRIILSEENVFRGFNLGASKEEIKQKELLKIHSENDSLLLYTLYLDADDSADLIYYFDASKKAKSFAIVFILNDLQEEENLRTELTRYYKERYGQFAVINQEDEVWDSQRGYLVEMRDTSDEAGMEIEIVYYPK